MMLSYPSARRPKLLPPPSHRTRGLVGQHSLHRTIHAPMTTRQGSYEVTTTTRPAKHYRNQIDPLAALVSHIFVARMYRSTYDSDTVTFSPLGRIHQIEYATVSPHKLSQPPSSRRHADLPVSPPFYTTPSLRFQEAVKQGSAIVGLRSKYHAVLVALKRAPSELAAHQQKLLTIDSHMGIGFAGLTNDARVLSNWMRQLALSSRMVYSRPLPLSRVANSLADRAQLNTMEYGRRPYGVGFLIIGHDSTGPHLYEFSPVGTCFEYYAMSLGARSQSAKTYLDRKFEEYKNEEDLEKLILHGLYALRETLQQGKELEVPTISVAVVGPGSDVPAAELALSGIKPEKFRIIEGDELGTIMNKMEARR